jgi:hypothetical protein
MIAKLICYFKGHKRGVRIENVGVTSTVHMNHYRCPRCQATWMRKAKA